MNVTLKRRLLTASFVAASIAAFCLFLNSAMTPDIHRSFDRELGIGYVYVHDDDQKAGRQHMVQGEFWSFDPADPVESVSLEVVGPGQAQVRKIPMSRAPESSLWVAPVGIKKHGLVADNFTGSEIRVSDRYLFTIEACTESGKKARVAPGRNRLEEIMGWAGEKKFKLTFEGEVDRFWLILHVALMVAAPLFLLHAVFYSLCVLAAVGDPLPRIKSSLLAGWCCFTISAIPIGIIVTWQAFHVGFEPWPFGGDITDTKSLFLCVVWLAMLVALRKRGEKAWAVSTLAASAVSAAVYLIPHSMIAQ